MRTTLGVISALAFAASVSLAQGPAGNASAGARLFQELKCASCHSVKGAGGKSAPALGGASYTPNTMAAAMWSHVAKMWQAMDKAGYTRPQLTEKQAADLYVYIAGGSHPDPPGDAKAGGQVYQAKLCATCHDELDTGAPRLTGAGRFSSFSLMAAIWQHGKGMLSQMVSKNLAWQQLSAAEVGGLVAYINTKK